MKIQGDMGSHTEGKVFKSGNALAPSREGIVLRRNAGARRHTTSGQRSEKKIYGGRRPEGGRRLEKDHFLERRVMHRER